MEDIVKQSRATVPAGLAGDESVVRAIEAARSNLDITEEFLNDYQILAANARSYADLERWETYQRCRLILWNELGTESRSVEYFRVKLADMRQAVAEFKDQLDRGRTCLEVNAPLSKCEFSTRPAARFDHRSWLGDIRTLAQFVRFATRHFPEFRRQAGIRLGRK